MVLHKTYRVNLWLWGRRIGGEIIMEFGINMYTLLYLKWITSKDLLYSTWNSAQCYLAAWMGGEFGGECIHAYVWLRPWAADLKLLQHCLLICYTPIRKKKYKTILEDSHVSKAVMFTPQTSGNVSPFMLNWWLLKTVNFTK